MFNPAPLYDFTQNHLAFETAWVRKDTISTRKFSGSVPSTSKLRFLHLTGLATLNQNCQHLRNASHYHFCQPEPATLEASDATSTDDVAFLSVANKASRDSASQFFADAALHYGPSGVESVGFNEAVRKALFNERSPTSREPAW